MHIPGIYHGITLCRYTSLLKNSGCNIYWNVLNYGSMVWVYSIEIGVNAIYNQMVYFWAIPGSYHDVGIIQGLNHANPGIPNGSASHMTQQGLLGLQGAGSGQRDYQPSDSRRGDRRAGPGRAGI